MKINLDASARSPYLRILLFFAIIFTYCFLAFKVAAQNGSPCYQPLTGSSAVASEVQGGVLCINCTSFGSLENLRTASRQDYALFQQAGLLAGSGVSVRDTVQTFPAGWHAGYVVSFDNSVLTASLLGGVTLQTYNNGSLRESKTIATGLSVAILGEDTRKLYLNFPTTLTFDEVRIVHTAAVAVTDFRIYYAMAFDPQCGLSDNNIICLDQIAGPSASVSFNGGLTNALVNFANPSNVTNGNRNSFASLTLPAGVSLLSAPPYVGVLEKELVHPAGRKTGFVIRYDASLLTADVLNALSLQTYLRGQLQETATFTNGSGLLRVSALAASGTGKKEISFTTTLPFNEVRLVVSQSASVDVGTIDIYYAFESGGACTDGKTILATSAPAPDNAAIEAARTGTFGVVCVNQSLSGTANVVSSSSADFATFTPALLSVGCGAEISVKNNGTDYPAGTFAGFALSKLGGLLDLGLLDAITINVYKDNNNVPVASGTGGSLLDLGVANADQGMTTIGFQPGVPFDEVQIVFNSGLISAALDGEYHIYYAYIMRDTDGDGVPDPIDICAGNDGIDTDGDGTPDDCDPCTGTGDKSVYADTDGDGIADACDADSDDDGIADAVENTNSDTRYDNDDLDVDGIANYLDLDSDNDGITDLYESGISTSLTASLDANHNSIIDPLAPRGQNGMTNSIEASDNLTAGNNYILANTDGDDAPDYIDLDTDNDGINDIYEGRTPPLADADGDGMADGSDEDRDGINSTADGNPVRGSGTLTGPSDTDGDGVPDARDLDSDNDLVSDLTEGGSTGYTDADNNGVADGGDSDDDGIVTSLDGAPAAFGDDNAMPPIDTDGDGTPDYRDPDSNNDGTTDIVDAGLGGEDLDGDGMADDPADPDGDGIPNDNGNDLDPGGFGGLGTSTILNIQLLLEGALVNNGTLMRDDLRQQSLIPLNQPYNAALGARFAGHGGGGEEKTTSSILAEGAGTNDAIVDWVFLEVRSSADSADIIRTASALVQKDGSVVGGDGKTFGLVLPAGSYYLSVKHRNHLGVMTATSLVTSSSPATIDFKNGTTPTYGTNATKLVAPGHYALYAGDANSDGSVYYTAPDNDRDAILLKLGGNEFGYLNTYNTADLNMEGQTYYTAPGNDRDYLLQRPLDGDEFGYLQEQLP